MFLKTIIKLYLKLWNQHLSFLLWYGKNKISNFKTIYKRRNYKCNAFTKTLAFPILRHGSLNSISTLIYIPYSWDFLLLKPLVGVLNSRVLYLFSKLYFFKITFTNSNLKWYFDKQSNTLKLSNFYTPNFFKLYINLILNTFYSFSKLFFLKLKFKGKGYYIYKNSRNTITSQFGHSHRIYIYSVFISVKFLTKTTVFLFGSSKTDILTTGYSIKKAKPINIFTGRGVRFSKQIIYKKTGKVSSYI